MTSRVRTILIHALGWLAVSLITTSQGILAYLATGGEVHVVPVLLLNLALWLPWAVLSPLILAAARRWPLVGRVWPRHLAAHVSLNLVLALVAAVLYRVLRAVVGIPVRGNYAVMITSGLNTAVLVYWGLVAIAHATAYYRRTQERQRLATELDRQLAEARLEALQSPLRTAEAFGVEEIIDPRLTRSTLCRFAALAAALRQPGRPHFGYRP